MTGPETKRKPEFILPPNESRTRAVFSFIDIVRRV